MMMHQINHPLATARRLAGLTQAELAHAVGRSQSTVAAWETGQATPSIRLLVAVANRYGLSDADLGRLLRSLAPEGAPLLPEAQS